MHLRAAMLVACITLAMVWISANADEVPLITGEHWTKSSDQLKKVYLIGIANVIQVASDADVPVADLRSILSSPWLRMSGWSVDRVGVITRETERSR
jgi:hypothetical protein